MNEEKTTSPERESAASNSTSQFVAFDELMRDYEQNHVAHAYIPVNPQDEYVPVYAVEKNGEKLLNPLPGSSAPSTQFEHTDDATAAQEKAETADTEPERTNEASKIQAAEPDIDKTTAAQTEAETADAEPESTDETTEQAEIGKSDIKPKHTDEAPVARTETETADSEPKRKKATAAKSKKRSKSERKPLNLKGFVTVAVFTTIIAAVLAANIISPDRTHSDTENRTLASMPTVTFSGVFSGSFMQRFESHVSDQFIFRDEIVSLRSAVNRILGSKEQNGIYIGKSGQLFEKQEEYNVKKLNSIAKSINTFCRNNPKLKATVFVAPTASYILRDKLPDFVEPHNQKKVISRFYGRLDSNVETLNVINAFEKRKNEQKLYYLTDHHWTTRAAKVAFNLLAKKLGINTDSIKYEYHTVSTTFSGTLSKASGIYESADTIEICMPSDSKGTYVVKNADLQTKETSLFELSKLETDNPYELFCGGNFSRLTISTTNRNEKVLLVFKDSYANCLIPMLTPYYQEIVVIDPRYFTDNIEDILNSHPFTDVLFIYNIDTLAKDTSLSDVIE